MIQAHDAQVTSDQRSRRMLRIAQLSGLAFARVALHAVDEDHRGGGGVCCLVRVAAVTARHPKMYWTSQW